MKNLLLVTAILLVGACATIPALEEKVVGTYETKDSKGNTWRLVLLDNGVAVGYGGSGRKDESTWKITDGEIHAGPAGDVWVFKSILMAA
tara:strand:- start:24 stop:293 length:270 start_codon:yes stop_codon:yes gene_type:complete